MKKQAWATLCVIGLLLASLACGEATPAPPQNAAAPLVLDTGHQGTIEAAQVERYLRAIEAEDTLRVYHAEATATAEAHVYQQWAATATAEAVRFEATAAAWAAYEESLRAQATATAVAQAAAETRAVAAWEATATAEAVRFQQAATAQAVAIEATATAIAHRAHREAAESEAAAQQAQLEARRAELVYPLRAYGPWVLVTLLAGLLFYGALRLIAAAEVQARAIRRDARGDAPVLVLPNGRGGGMVVYDPDRSFGPAMLIDAEVTMPALVAAEQQAAVTMRDQAVDLATRGLPRPENGRAPGPSQAQRQRQAARLALTGAPPQVKIIAPTGAAAGWLRDVREQALALTLEEGEAKQ